MADPTAAPTPADPAVTDPAATATSATSGDYDVVLLIEEALTAADAAQVRSLHEGLDQPVTYHVLLPIDDAAAQVEASLGSMGSGDLLGTGGMTGPLGVPGIGMGSEQLQEIREESRSRSDAELAASLEALEAAGADAKGEVTLDPPVEALAAMIKAVDGREAIVLTRPHVVAEFFHLDWSAQARRKLGVPVLHLLEHETFDEQAGEGEGVNGV